jgi:hypothetical protein
MREKTAALANETASESFHQEENQIFGRARALTERGSDK